MENFLGIKYKGKNKLTHKEMNEYLREKHYPIPNTVRFDQLNKEKILRGHYLIVQDETKKVVPYLNPRRIENLMAEILIYQKNNDLAEKRKKILSKKFKNTNIAMATKTNRQ